MTKSLFYISTLLLSLQAIAQVSIMQGSSSIEWKKIENEYFEIVYPSKLKDKADYILSQLNYFRPIVNKSYGISPKKISIVLRSEMAEPNGFVTLAPRRSEWYASHSITPLVGGLNWYQSLAVHEYRHVVQLDHLNQGYTRWGYALFGEQVLGFLINVVMPNWYFEGDAVWAETAYSDAGRGRSPRFSARLKSLLINDQIPKYDDLLIGDYNQNLPNLYVYGYYLTARAYKKFGPKVWKKITVLAANRPWNVWAFYNAFEQVTKQNFESFYKDSMQELKEEWTKEETQVEEQKEFEKVAMIKVEQGDEYTLRWDFNNHWRLFKNKKELTELNISPTLSKPDFKSGKLIYVQNIIDKRYSFKNYSDLYIYDTKTNTNTRLTVNKRIFHPSFSPDGSKIITTVYNDKEDTELHIFDLNGELLEVLPKIKENHQFAEAVWKNDSEVFIIILDMNGYKQVIHYNIIDKTFKTLIPTTRNNIFYLQAYDDSLYFEADDEGAVNIFKIDLSSQDILRCTNTNLITSAPHPTKGNLYYIESNYNGSAVKKSLGNCDELINPEYFKGLAYIGKTPSDNYTKNESFLFKSPNTQKHSEKDYNETSGIFTPYAWDFLLTRGTSLEVRTQNKIGTMNSTLLAGVSSEDKTPLASVRFNYAKYYPIFSVYGAHQKRKDSYKIAGATKNFDWSENIYGASVTLPYFLQKSLYTGVNALTLGTSMIEITDDTGSNSSSALSDNKLTTKDISISSSYAKRMTRKQLLPSFSYSFSSLYVDLETEKNDRTNYFSQTQFDLSFEMPTQDHSLAIKTSRQVRPKDEALYNFQNSNLLLQNYTFSRGYVYEFTPEFNKYTLEYTLPLAYPKWGIKDYIYFNRIHGTVFYDHTDVEFNEQRRTLNSYGFELSFNSNTFRKIPLTYGYRFIKKEADGTTENEVFINLFSN